MRCIDPHVHCRDGNEDYKTNIREVSEIAENQGILAIFDMPNTNPPILIEKDVVERLVLAGKRKPVVKYFLYVGLTSRKKQIKEAVRVVRKYPEVVGLKLYCAKSGSLGVSREKAQQKVYNILADLGYTGVLAVHCEKESRLRPDLWNPQKPWTHSSARPPKAEIESVRDQIRFAKKAKFKGHLHICHISCHESVDLVCKAKKKLNISSGATLHNLRFSDDLLRQKDGLLYKVNPPLRNRRRAGLLMDRLRQRKIDCLETDHAPHTREEKLNSPYLSGIDSLLFYRESLLWLTLHGLHWLDVGDLTYWNIKKIFREKLKKV